VRYWATTRLAAGRPGHPAARVCTGGRARTDLGSLASAGRARCHGGQRNRRNDHRPASRDSELKVPNAINASQLWNLAFTIMISPSDG
jgi:hypothetical protein